MVSPPSAEGLGPSFPTREQGECGGPQQSLVGCLGVSPTQHWGPGIHPIPHPRVPACTSVTSSLLRLLCFLRTISKLHGPGLPAPLRADAEWTSLLLQQLLPAGRGQEELQRSVWSGQSRHPQRGAGGLSGLWPMPPSRQQCWGSAVWPKGLGARQTLTFRGNMGLTGRDSASLLPWGRYMDAAPESPSEDYWEGVRKRLCLCVRSQGPLLGLYVLPASMPQRGCWKIGEGQQGVIRSM